MNGARGRKASLPDTVDEVPSMENMISVEDHHGVPVVGVVRTYRRLASGSVLLPDPPLLPSASA